MGGLLGLVLYVLSMEPVTQVLGRSFPDHKGLWRVYVMVYKPLRLVLNNSETCKRWSMIYGMWCGRVMYSSWK